MVWRSPQTLADTHIVAAQSHLPAHTRPLAPSSLNLATRAIYSAHHLGYEGGFPVSSIFPTTWHPVLIFFSNLHPRTCSLIWGEGRERGRDIDVRNMD